MKQPLVLLSPCYAEMAKTFCKALFYQVVLCYTLMRSAQSKADRL